MPGQKDRSWSFRAAWIVLILITALATTDAVLAPTPAPQQPDFIDTILASRAVVAAIRIGIVFAAIFVVISVVALIARRQWLTRLGPVEVFDPGVEKQQLEEELEAARDAIDVLEGRAAYTQRVVDKGEGK